MDYDASSVRTDSEFQLYFPNASYQSPADYIKSAPLDTYRISLIAAYSALLIIGVSANAWVARVVGIVLSQTRTEAPRAVQIFILALCGCDVFVLLFLSLLLIDLWYGQFVVQSSFLCQSYLMSESLSKFYAPFLLVELSGFCFLNVKRRRCATASFNSRSGGGARSSWKTTKMTLLAVILALALAFALMTPVYLYSDVYYLIVHNGSNVDMVQRKCAFQPPDYILTAFTTYSFVCGYLIPAFLFTVFYAALLIYVHLRRRKSSCTTAKSLDYFSRVARTSFFLVLFYFVSWTPYWVMSLYQYLDPFDGSGEVSDAMVKLSYFIHMLPYINCNAYPLLYTLLNRSIQHDYSRACEFSKSQKERRRNLAPTSFRNGLLVRSSSRKSNSTSTYTPSTLITNQSIIRKISAPVQSSFICHHESLILKKPAVENIGVVEPCDGQKRRGARKMAFSLYRKCSKGNQNELLVNL